MSNLLWRALIVSPAVLGATLLISAGAVRAAGSDSLIANDSQKATATVQPQYPEAQKLEEQSQAIAPTTETTSPEAKQQPEFSTAATAASAQPQLPDVKLPSQVSLTPSQLTPANPTAQDAAPAGLPQSAPSLAQSAPAPGESNSADVLNQINRYSREGNNAASQDQVTNVSQLSDVRPTDWAYEALRSLVERYGCIAGYPDGTFRGNRAMTRYEFAAGLNACLQQVERLIATSTSEFVTKSDLETLQRLVDEFRTELTTLGTRVDKLEGRVAFLEDHQFSTTTKLGGEAIFALTDEFGQGVSNNTVFQDRVRLTFNTSFTGRDRLATRLAAGNASSLDASINNNAFKSSSDINPLGQSYSLSEGQQTFNITGGSTTNNVVLDWLAYYFNFGSSKVYVAATGGIHSDYAPTLNPYFEDYDGGNGALTTFASESPIYRIGGGAGAAVSFGVGPLQSILGPSTLTVGYLAGTGALGANNPNEKAGLFDGDYSALAQLNVNVGDRIGLGLTYVHGYHNKNTAIFDGGSSVGGVNVPTFYDPNSSIGPNPPTDNIGRGIVGAFNANNPGVFSYGNLGARKLTPVVSNS